MVRLHKNIKVVDPESGKQTLLVLPPQFVAQAGRGYAAEFWELDELRLLLFLIDPKKAQNPTYKLVDGHRVTQVSIPRPWLRDRSAKSSDLLEIYEDTAQPDRLLIRLRRAGAQLPVPAWADFRRVDE